MSHLPMGSSPPHRQITGMIDFTDWWRFDTPHFPGQRCLADTADDPSADKSAAGIARMLVLQIAAASLHGAHPSIHDIAVAGSYMGLLGVADPEAGGLWQCIAAVRTRDTAMLAAGLHKAARQCMNLSAPQAAREFAELSYEAALACGSWEDGFFAASILTRLAELDECPPASEQWEHRARMQENRVLARTAKRNF